MEQKLRDEEEGGTTRKPTGKAHAPFEEMAAGTEQMGGGTSAPWSPPTSAYESLGQWGESQRSSVAGSEWGMAAAPTGGGAGNYNTGGQTSLMSSRRSSLKSSLLELEAFNRPESPGPLPTEDPLEGVKVEVVVTQAVQKEPLSPRPEEDETRLKTNDERLFSLMPVGFQTFCICKVTLHNIFIFKAPTPTRFVGRMHAVLSSPRRRSGSDSFSRKSSLVPETIQEDETSPTSDAEAKDENTENGAKDSDKKVEEKVVKEEKKEEVKSRVASVLGDMSTGVPTSTRFVGKMRGAVMKSGKNSVMSTAESSDGRMR